MSSISHIVLGELRLSNLKPAYYQREAEQLLHDGLAGEQLHVFVRLGCAGSWVVDFVRNGQLFVAAGELGACPYCWQLDEMDGPSIDKPVEALLSWLDGAKICSASTASEGALEILSSDPDFPLFALHEYLQRAGL